MNSAIITIVQEVAIFIKCLNNCRKVICNMWWMFLSQVEEQVESPQQ